MRLLSFVFLFLFLTACVNIPEDELALPVVEPAPAAVEAPAAAEAQVTQNASLLAPLPDESKPNASAAKPQSAASTAQPRQSQYAWTTESLSIEEGETKMVYVKKG